MRKRKVTKTEVKTPKNSNQDEVIYDLMLKLLKNDYPIVKVKEKNRFKRGIVIDGKKYLLPRDNNMVFFALFSLLDLLYGVHEDITTKVITDFYNL